MIRHSPAVSANPEVTLRALTLILSESGRGQQDKYRKDWSDNKNFNSYRFGEVNFEKYRKV